MKFYKKFLKNIFLMITKSFLKKSKLISKNDFLNFNLINTPLGEKRSGYERYAAAMYFYNKGLLSNDMLEIYRICCKFDNKDPIKLANKIKNKL